MAGGHLGRRFRSWDEEGKLQHKRYDEGGASLTRILHLEDCATECPGEVACTCTGSGTRD
jgi:hypothetical protein